MAEAPITQQYILDFQSNLEVRANKADKRLEQLNIRLGKGTISLGRYEEAVAKLENQMGRQVKTLGRMKQSFHSVAASAKNASGAAANLGTQFAFLASDAGFLLQDPRLGLLAIGNNLSQITISAGIAAKQAGGLGKALKQAFTGGSLFLIGLNLIITVLPQLARWLSNSKKAANALGDAIGGAHGTAAELETLVSVLDDSTSSFEEQQIALQKLKKHGFDPTIASYKTWLKFKQAELLFEATREIRLKKLKELVAERLELEKEAEEAAEKFKNAPKQAILGASPLNPGQSGARDGRFLASQDADKDLKEAEKAVKDQQKLITDELDSFSKLVKDNGWLDLLITGEKGKSIRDKAAELLQRLKDTLVNASSTAFERIEADRERAKVNAKKTITDKEDLAEALNLIDEIYDHKQEELTQKYLEREKKKAERLKASYDRQIEISARREDILNRILARAAERRVQLEAAANQRIFDAKAGFYNQLIGLGRQFAGENKEVLIALLIAEKTIAGLQLVAKSKVQIAGAIAANSASDAQITASANAIPPILPPATPNPAAVLAKVSAAKSIGLNKISLTKTLGSIKTATAFGLAGLGVGAIGGIASISKGGGTSGGSSGGSREPSFQLIGATGTNQLKDAIERQKERENNKPIKAQVVLSEVNSMQELERLAENQASI